MTTAPTVGVGWTLAKLAALTPRRSPRSTDDATVASREQILELLQQGPGPLLIEDLTQTTGLHANTIRGHLDVLLAAGEVTRTRATAGGRGRPPWRYAASHHARTVASELRMTLDAQLGAHGAADQVFINEAAERWAEAMGPDLVPGDVTSPGEAVDAAAAALTRVGFSAEVSPLGDSITLHTCPYAALIADHPVICDIHTALLTDLLARTGQGVEVEQMQVWTTPTACLARLARPDLVPERVVIPPGTAATKPTPPTRKPGGPKQKHPKRKKNQ